MAEKNDKRFFASLRCFTIIGTLALLGHVSPALSESADSLATQQEESAPQATQPQWHAGSAGKYLSSHFAQSQNDWRAANGFLNHILQTETGNDELLRRSMILAMGSGDMALAVQRARELVALGDGDNGLPLMILAVNDMAAGNMTQADGHLQRMQPGDMTDFVKPILKGWIDAALGKFNTEGFNDTTIHHYHGGMIAAYLDDKNKLTEYAQKLIELGTLSNVDAERTGDLLAALGRFEEAAVLYEGIFVQDTRNKKLGEKLEEVKKENGGNIRELIEPLEIKTAQQGASRALYDMAYILYQEHSDSSTKLFANMALALDPSLTDAHLLLADTLTRNGRLEEAIAQLGNVPPDHPSYLTVQRHAAELLAEVGRDEEALAKLNDLFINHNDVESLIRIGDLYRQQEDYNGALLAYNKAADHIGDKIPEEFWYLLYARGMAYERQGDWNKAENDLKAALVYRPDHPYLLNYLGYGWADQGLNLEQSLELINRAVALRPTDGYIIDSLGWVQYMMGEYKEALPNLEKAVELLPYDSTINDHLGDAYWQTGRRMEARFQWERAMNYSEEAELKEKLAHKLRFGLEGMESVRQAGAAK